MSPADWLLVILGCALALAYLAGLFEGPAEVEFVCPDCHQATTQPGDVAQRFCPFCSVFHPEVPRSRARAGEREERT